MIKLYKENNNMHKKFDINVLGRIIENRNIELNVYNFNKTIIN